MKVEFSGGLDTLFAGSRELELDFGTADVTVQDALARLAEIVRENNADLSLFLQDGLVRPGILVLINDVDWELLDREDSVVGPKDTVHFSSTLHGG